MKRSSLGSRGALLAHEACQDIPLKLGRQARRANEDYREKRVLKACRAWHKTQEPRGTLEQREIEGTQVLKESKEVRE